MSNLEKEPISGEKLSEIVKKTISGKGMYDSATFLIDREGNQSRGENFRILIRNQTELGVIALVELEHDLAPILSKYSLEQA